LDRLGDFADKMLRPAPKAGEEPDVATRRRRFTTKFIVTTDYSFATLPRFVVALGN
jgi:hypothetical protein